MQLSEFKALQETLDTLIMQKVRERQGIYPDSEELLKDRQIALMTEVSEFANSTELFKYWKVNKNENREQQLEEYVDILFFWLSIGNLMNFSPKEIEAAYMAKYQKNIERQVSNY